MKICHCGRWKNTRNRDFCSHWDLGKTNYPGINQRAPNCAPAVTSSKYPEEGGGSEREATSWEIQSSMLTIP